MRALSIFWIVLSLACPSIGQSLASAISGMMGAVSAPSGYGTEDFVTTWALTTDTEAGRTITLPLRSGFTYDFTVDWGDGNSSTVTAFDDADRIHVYDSTGTYTVVKSGTIQAWFFNNGGDRLKFRTVEHWGENVGFTGTGFLGAFYGCANAIYFADLPFYNVISLENFLRNCTSLTVSPSVNALTNVSTLLFSWNGSSQIVSVPSIAALTGVNTIFGAWGGCTSLTSAPSVATLTNLNNMRAAWFNCTSLTNVPSLPSASTALTETQSAFSGARAMGGAVVELWNTNNFPNVTSFVNTFLNATNLTNYADIPNNWKGL